MSEQPRRSEPTRPTDGGAPSHRRGPVTLRGQELTGETTDQHLLDSRGPADWVHTDP